MADLQKILEQFGVDPSVHDPVGFGSGLIHATYVIMKKDEPCYILQRVNHQVFKKPEDIAHNLRVIGNYLQIKYPGYLFTTPIPGKEGNDYVMESGNYYRLFAFVKNTHTIDVCTQPQQAWEAARQFGKFTAVLNDFRTDMLRYTIPGFHDLSLRYRQFEEALANGDSVRRKETVAIGQQLLDFKNIVSRYEHYKNSSSFRQRVTHHDTKISNVLFDKSGNGVCVIDLDTVMPGLFISDIGDMIRTYVSPANEEERDLEKVVVRTDFVDAIISGYSEEMHDLLSEEERGAFIYAGDFMIYMQALRFYTDHLQNDKYYGAAYEGHNLVRAKNQLKLLDELIKMN
jgi:Ser/Thr protein kinase RdoA (MazF antagonist)